MHGGARGGFEGLQVQPAGLALAGEYCLQEGVDFAVDFFLNRFRRFFSCGAGTSSGGRARQIWALIATKARLNS